MKKFLSCLALFCFLSVPPAFANNTSPWPSSGSVGIGTTSPGKLLDVYGSAKFGSSENQFNTDYPFSVNVGTNQNLGIRSGGSIIQFTAGTDDDQSYNTMEIDASPLVINTNSGGNVGIGTTSPATLLDVRGQTNITYSSFPVLQVERTTTGTVSGHVTTGTFVAEASGTIDNGFGPTVGWQIEDSSGVYHPLVEIGASVDGGNDTGDMVFSTFVSGAGTERMRILNNGNVGIGTTSPQTTLDVNGLVRLALNSSVPATCSSSNKGAIALTHLAQVCVCDTTPAWHILNTSTACSW